MHMAAVYQSNDSDFLPQWQGQTGDGRCAGASSGVWSVSALKDCNPDFGRCWVVHLP